MEIAGTRAQLERETAGFGILRRLITAFASA